MSVSSHLRNLRRLAFGGAVAAALCAMPRASQGFTVLMDHLANPRGIAIGPDGGIYVAEGGTGGSLGGFTNLVGPQDYGATGSVSRLLAGTQSRVYTNLPSVAPTGQSNEAVGPSGLAFDSSGQLNIVVGLGGNPSVRTSELNGLTSSNLLGQIVRPTSTTTYAPFSDVSAFEGAHDPDGAGIDTDPYGIKSLPGGKFAAVDAGGNDLLLIDSTGTVTQSVVFPARPNPLPFGPPFFQSVPTDVVEGPDGKLYISELTGFPFPAGGADIFQVDPALASPAANVFATGLTNVTSLDFGPDGKLYATELDVTGLASPSGFGDLVRINADGSKTVIAGNLSSPTGLKIGSDGTFYVSINGTSATTGEVIAISAVPLPTAAWEVLASLPIVFVAMRKMRAKAV